MREHQELPSAVTSKTFRHPPPPRKANKVMKVDLMDLRGCGWPRKGEQKVKVSTGGALVPWSLWFHQRGNREGRRRNLHRRHFPSPGPYRVISSTESAPPDVCLECFLPSGPGGKYLFIP